MHDSNESNESGLPVLLEVRLIRFSLTFEGFFMLAGVISCSLCQAGSYSTGSGESASVRQSAAWRAACSRSYLAETFEGHRPEDEL